MTSRFFGRRMGVLGVLIAGIALVGCSSTPQEKTAKFMAEGKEMLKANDINRAILAFKNAGQLMPNDAEIFYQLGNAYLLNSDLRQGVSALRKALEIDPKHSAAQLRMSELMAASEDPELLKDAQQRLEALLATSPDDPNALHALALTELKLGDSKDGMEHVQLALAAAPTELRIALTLAQAKFQKKDFKGAEEVLRGVIEKSPKDSQTHSVLADLLLAQNKLTEAEAELLQAVSLSRFNKNALVTLGRLESKLGKKAEAERAFKTLAGMEGYYIAYGNFLFEENRREEAVKEFEQLYKAHPDDRQIRTSLVAAYARLDRDADARRVVNDAIKKNPKDLEALLQRGEMGVTAGDLVPAEADLNAVAQMQPNSAEVHYALAKLGKARGNSLTYRQEMAKTLELNPYLMIVRLEVAQEFIESGNPKPALDVLNGAPGPQRDSLPIILQKNWVFWAASDNLAMRKGIDAALAQEKSAEALIQDGLWKIRSGQTAAGRASLETALQMKPSDLRAITGLQGTYSAKESGLALQKVSEYAAREPNSAPLQHHLGVMLMVEKNYAGARKSFAATKKADPKFVDVDRSLVQLDMAEGKLDDAIGRLKQVLAANPNDKLGYLWMGNLLESKGDHGASIENLRKAVQLDPDNALALNNLAYILAEHGGQVEEALKHAQKAVEIAPKDPTYADTLGWVMYKKGLYAPALQYLTKAVSQPSDVVPQYHLAMAYAKAGELAKGRATLNAALKVNSKVPEAQAAREALGDVR